MGERPMTSLLYSSSDEVVGTSLASQMATPRPVGTSRMKSPEAVDSPMRANRPMVLTDLPHAGPELIQTVLESLSGEDLFGMYGRLVETVGASPAWMLEVSVPLTDRSGEALLSALTMEDRMESPDWEVRSVENDDSFL